MATKYGPRKKHNSGTVRSSTNTQGGSRTRKTVTTKTGNFTRSRSVNRNGTVRLTTTHKAPNGFITRKTTTVGSVPSKPKAPKFIKAKPFKAPKMKVFKAPKMMSTSGRRRGSSSSGGGEVVALVGFGLIAGLFSLIAWLFSLLFGGNKEESQEQEIDESGKILILQLDQLTDNQAKILFYDTLNIWVDADSLTQEQKDKILNFDWKNFDFDAWREENGYENKTQET